MTGYTGGAVPKFYGERASSDAESLRVNNGDRVVACEIASGRAVNDDDDNGNGDDNDND